MTEDYLKPLKPVYEIEGVENEFERVMAGEILVDIYNLTCEIMNSRGIEEFNSNWNKEHPDWLHTEDPDDYDLAYMRYFKGVADQISERVRSKGGLTYKLREYECVLLNGKTGTVTIYGYKDQK